MLTEIADAMQMQHFRNITTETFLRGSRITTPSGIKRSTTTGSCHLKTARIGVFSPRSNEKWAFCRLRHACRVVLVPCRPPGRYDHRSSGLELHGGKDASSFSKDSDRTELHVDPGHIYVPLCLPACCVVVQLAMSPVSRYADVGKIADQLRKSLLSMDRKAVT